MSITDHILKGEIIASFVNMIDTGSQWKIGKLKEVALRQQDENRTERFIIRTDNAPDTK